jgi:hypothetical protein
MNSSIRILFASILALTAAAAYAEERVYLLRSQEDATMTKPACASDEAIVLAAKLYAPRSTRTGYVFKDTGRPIGTAVACGKLLSYRPFDPAVQNSFRLTITIRDATITANGVCTLDSLTFPVQGSPGPLMLAGCTLKVNGDAAQGILNGQASSASVFTPIPLAGYHTGSFWTVQLYVDDTFGRKHPRCERDEDEDE